MKKGIMINGKHTFNDFGAILASRKDEFPDIVRVTESVPYSNVVHDFSALYGDVSYTQREIVYKFKFIGEYATMMRDKLADFFFSIATSAVDIYDDEMGADYHWHGCLQSVKRVDTVGEQFGARMIEVTFLCDYQRVPNESDFYEADSEKWPDVDGDGAVTSADASMIMHAVAEIGLDHPSGLTPEQEIMADCDRDGSITAVDGSLALKFVAECGVDRFENTPEGWARFLNVMFGKDTKEI